MPSHRVHLMAGTHVMLTKESQREIRIVQQNYIESRGGGGGGLHPNCIKAVIMSGVFAGKEVIIPRATLINLSTQNDDSFWKQFAVQVVFAKTIDKSEVQCIQHLRLFL